MTLRPRERHEALQAARRQQETAEWKAEYAVRAGIEGTLSQGVRGFGLRRCRYIGLAKARLQHVATAAAINVYRLSDWLGGVPRSAAGTWCPDVKGTKVDEALSLGWENLFGRLDGPMSFPGAHQAGGSHAPRDPCWIEGCATASPPSWRPFSRMRLSATICCARAGRMWTPFSSSPSSWTRSVRVASWPRHPPRTATTGRDTYR